MWSFYQEIPGSLSPSEGLQVFQGCLEFAGPRKLLLVYHRMLVGFGPTAASGFPSLAGGWPDHILLPGKITRMMMMVMMMMVTKMTD